MSRKNEPASKLAMRVIAGAAASTAALVSAFGLTLLLSGGSRLEWGVGPSLAISLGVTWVGYCLGAAALCLVRWWFRRSGRMIEPRFVVFGIAQATAMWASTEIPWIYTKIPSSFPSDAALLASLLVAVIIALLVGRRSNQA